MHQMMCIKPLVTLTGVPASKLKTAFYLIDRKVYWYTCGQFYPVLDDGEVSRASVVIDRDTYFVFDPKFIGITEIQMTDRLPSG